MTYKEVEDELRKYEEYPEFNNLSIKEKSTFIWLAANYIPRDQWQLALPDYITLVGEPLKTSHEWHSIVDSDTQILDPDGWDRKNYQYSFYEEKITKAEFKKRLAMSTIMKKMSAD